MKIDLSIFSDIKRWKKDEIIFFLGLTIDGLLI